MNYKLALARQRRNKKVYKKLLIFFKSIDFEKSFFKVANIILLFALGLNYFNVPITDAYFTNTEISAINIFTAKTLDFRLAPSTNFISSPLDKGGATSTIITMINDGDIGFQYTASTTILGGDNDLCSYLNLQASLNGIFVYNSAVSGFSTLAKSYVDPSIWNFVITLPSGASDSLQDKSCNFKVTFDGWQEGLLSTQGFNDTEQINISVYSGHWAVPIVPSIVLNEFLPNPEGTEYGFDFGSDNDDMPKGEWVELYNNSDTDVNLTGWYLRDSTSGDGNKTPIDLNHVYYSSLIIGPHKWLVVYMNKQIYNNNGDTVKLFNADNVLVDFYSYGTNPDYCDMEPTPNDENNTTPVGSCSGVPGNKSYARIPDGIGAWVDPIPTPGGTNMLEGVLEMESTSSGTIILPEILATTTPEIISVIETATTTEEQIASTTSESIETTSVSEIIEMEDKSLMIEQTTEPIVEPEAIIEPAVAEPVLIVEPLFIE